MIRLQRITTADADWYRFMEELMVQSFPPEEYRPLEQLRLYTDTKPAFYNNIVLESDDTPVGFFTYWDFGTFCYGEHFAIDPARRNGGYGARVIERLCADLAFLPAAGLPAVGQALPATALQARRQLPAHAPDGLRRTGRRPGLRRSQATHLPRGVRHLPGLRRRDTPHTRLHPPTDTSNHT